MGFWNRSCNWNNVSTDEDNALGWAFTLLIIIIIVMFDLPYIATHPLLAQIMKHYATLSEEADGLPPAVHMEDFAQVFGQYPNDKYKPHSYANIAAVLWAEAGEDAVAEFVRRLVFSVVIGNADMHLKNWSLLYPDQRKPILSPGYDFVATLPYIPNDKLALSFGGSRSLAEVTQGQMRRFADTARIPASPLWQIAVETAQHTAEAWKKFEHADLLPKNLRASINKQILRVAATVT
jgi:serine/threonine-protein kinase HipA